MLTDNKFGFKTCTHEPCLYYKTDKDNNLMLIVQQVYDLLCCHQNPDECDKMAKKIQITTNFTNLPTKWLAKGKSTLKHIKEFLNASNSGSATKR